MGTGAALLAGKVMNDQSRAAGSGGESQQDVVVAAANIAYGQEISADNLRLTPLAVSAIRPDMLHTLGDVQGKIATGDIFQGEPIVRQRIADKTAGSMLASLVGENMRAVSVRVNDVIGVAGFLLPGNRVDVLASRMDGQRSLTRTVLQNIKVLAVDQTVAANKDTPVIVRAVTLEVSPQDSQMLFQAIQEGSIHLALRNPVDAALLPETADTTSEAQATPQPAEPPAPVPVPVYEEPAPANTGKVIGKAAEATEPVIVEAVETVDPAPPAPSITIIRGTTINKVVLPTGGN